MEEGWEKGESPQTACRIQHTAYRPLSRVPHFLLPLCNISLSRRPFGTGLGHCCGSLLSSVKRLCPSFSLIWRLFTHTPTPSFLPIVKCSNGRACQVTKPVLETMQV